ncbi:GNAT family N-acetyltransferase [Novosphingobium sp.]|uniref:GNAT family N-acetyltransferase n=1 Tax=Novosphingobium sp. TaxID=1874826 RepID=UPI0025F69920|nr:GNAT family N-acetyltransferase [Novosphingobium sp.]
MTTRGDDLDRIMAIMDAAFDPAFGEAWNRRQVEDALLMGNCYYGLLDGFCSKPADDAEAAGFFLSRHGFDEEELLLLAVDPRFRRRGIGRALMNQFAAYAKSRGANRLLLEMRSGNPAELLYRDLGFRPIGKRINYYRSADGTRIDALTFACD